jgi:hypothetical protein
MARIIAGVLQGIDHDRGQVTIGHETFELLQGTPFAPELAPGMGVTALVAEREGTPRIVQLRANTVPRFTTALAV